MFYIHQTSCISHQPTYHEVDLENLNPSQNNQLLAVEPKYSNIPIGQLRRMGRALRMGVGTGMQLLDQNKTDGIIIGTANSGIEDSITFLNQIIDYEEGRLTPTNFVQSTFNAIAGLLGMITKNTGYNATHVHRGLAFENVMLDAIMRLNENPGHTYLIGGVDEISVRNYRMEAMAGWYKTEAVSNLDLYQTDTPGSLPGEGAAMFIVNKQPQGAIAKLTALQLLNVLEPEAVAAQLTQFIQQHSSPANPIDLFLSGENGDKRFLKYYTACEKLIPATATHARFKHLTGEFQTASALALWLACHFLQSQHLPSHAIKELGTTQAWNRVLVYNNYHGEQHSFMMIERVAAYE